MFFLSSYDHFQRKLIIIAKSQGFFPWLFSLSWEQRKLSDLAEKTYGGGTPATSNEAFWNGTIPWIQSSDIADGKLFGVVPRKYITNEALNKSATQLVPENSLAIITRVGVGKLAFMPFSYTTSQDFLSLSKLNTEPFFTVYACYKKLQSELNAVQGTSIKGITKDELFAKVIMVPKYREQEQIGCFFRSLDNLITLHQHEPLFLVMLFFGGSYIFKSAWEQRKLGDCFSERVESMPDGELISVTINDGIKKFSELGRHDNSNEDKSKYKKVCVGDIAYNSMRMWQGASGYSPYEGIVSPAYTVLTPNTGIISKCLAYQFKLPEMTHTFQIHSQGITSDNWNLKYPTLSEIKIFVSPDEKEQEQIARFFTNLDNLITLHQRKGNLREKKSLDFAWEQRKFSEITYPAGEKNRDNLPLESYSITNENGFVPQNEKFENGGTMREADKRMYYIVSPQSFAYNPARINVGSIGYQNLDKNVIVSSLYEVFKTVDTVDDRFLWHWFKSSDFQKLIEQLQEGGVRLYFYYDKLCMGSIAMPSKEEQKHIGEFFDHLDNLITLHQREHKSNFRRKTNVKQSTRDRPFLLLLCSVDKGLQRGSGP